MSISTSLASDFGNADTGVWADLDTETLQLAEPTTDAAVASDGVVHLAGFFPPWGYMARIAIPDRLRTTGRVVVRVSMLVKKGAACVALVNGDDSRALQQKATFGTGAYRLSLDVEASDEIGSLVIRSGLAEEAEVAVEVLDLQFAVVPPVETVPALERILRGEDPKKVADERHHPALLRVKPWSGENEAGCWTNWLGVRTKLEYDLSVRPPSPGPVATTYPPVDDEYLEYVDVLEAAYAAEGRFTMVEVGAGYGRWMVNAWAALKALGKGDSKALFVGVEAEPTHYRWMREHLSSNGLDPDQHKLIQAAVGGTSGRVRFATGQAAEWYGQVILHTAEQANQVGQGRSVIETDCIPLSAVLDDLPPVDLLDMDIQGEELGACLGSRDALQAKVRRAHIGTHSTEIELGLRRLFRDLGWKCLHDYGHNTVARTPYGTFRSGDGIQTWINPALVPPGRSR